MTGNAVLIEELHALLARERQALRRADFASLQALVPRIEGLAGRLGPALGADDGRGAAGLRRSAEEVRRLSLAALSGLAAARERLEALRGSGSPLRTYDARGRVASFAPEAGSVERRG